MEKISPKAFVSQDLQIFTFLYKNLRFFTYEDMLEMIANWPDEVKKRFNVVRCFKDLSAGSLRVFVQPSIYLDRVRTAGIRNTIVPLGIASQYRLRGPMNRFEDAKQWLLNR